MWIDKCTLCPLVLWYQNSDYINDNLFMSALCVKLKEVGLLRQPVFGLNEFFKAASIYNVMNHTKKFPFMKENKSKATVDYRLTKNRLSD